jgi:hypothetical protein
LILSNALVEHPALHASAAPGWIEPNPPMAIETLRPKQPFSRAAQISYFTVAKEEQVKVRPTPSI